MSNKDLLDNIKKLRELTGVGFKDCKLALDECNSDIEKSIEYLRKKGLGGFANDWYWSSTERNFNDAWLQNFNFGNLFEQKSKT